MSKTTAPTVPPAKAKRPARLQILKDLKLLVTLISETPRLATQMVNEQPWLATERIPRIEGRNEFCGAQPLAFASAMRRVDVMGALLNAGASPHVVCPDKGQTPLALALASDGDYEENPGDREEAVNLLIASGARLTAIDNAGTGLLYDSGTSIPTPLFLKLLSKGAILNTYDDTGAHHICSMIDNIDRLGVRRANVLALIGAGVDLQPRAGAKGHPMLVALDRGECGIAQAMFDKGASLRHRNHLGRTLAHEITDTEGLAWAIAQDPWLLNEPDFQGKAPLSHHLEALASYGNSRLNGVIHLVEAGADLDAVDHQGAGNSTSPREWMSKIKLPQAQEVFRALQAQRAARDALADCQPRP